MSPVEAGMTLPARLGAAITVAVVLGLAAGSAVADTYPRQPGLDVAHYVFELELSDETDRIEGRTTVHLRIRGDRVSEVGLDLVHPPDGAPDRGMTVIGVTDGDSPLPWEHSDHRLRITLEPEGRRDERRQVVVRYRGVPADGLIIGPNDHGDRTFFSDNWPDEARHWLPVIDHPYDKATSEMVVTAPGHYQVVSNGLLVEETDNEDGTRRTHWRQSVPISPWLYVLGVARFAVEHRPAWRGIPIQTWVYPQDRETGFATFAEPTVQVLDFMAHRAGPYPYEKLAQVQSNSVRGGMESASAIFYGPTSAAGDRPGRWRNVIIHEIAHQWFGNSVTEDDWDHVWLSEGFATYFTHLFIEHSEGRDAFVARLRDDKDVIRSFDEEQPDYRIVHDELADMRRVVTQPGTYKKGAWVLHMLRGVVGDEAFWSGIRDYYARYRDANASTADFRRVMEDAHGGALDWFFDQWLTRGGMMEVEGTWAWEAGTLRLEVEQAQAAAPFRMPIEVGIDVAGEPHRRVETIEVRGRKQSFTLPLEAQPRSVVLDPRRFVLMDVDFVRRHVTRP
jgi:aminopeptidase N